MVFLSWDGNKKHSTPETGAKRASRYHPDLPTEVRISSRPVTGTPRPAPRRQLGSGLQAGRTEGLTLSPSRSGRHGPAWLPHSYGVSIPLF